MFKRLTKIFSPLRGKTSNRMVLTSTAGSLFVTVHICDSTLDGAQTRTNGNWPWVTVRN